MMITSDGDVYHLHIKKHVCEEVFISLLELLVALKGDSCQMAHGGRKPVSHLALGSFPSARNKAQIWWVPAMAIHSTLSSTPPTQTHKRNKHTGKRVL